MQCHVEAIFPTTLHLLAFGSCCFGCLVPSCNCDVCMVAQGYKLPEIALRDTVVFLVYIETACSEMVHLCPRIGYSAWGNDH